MRQLWSCYARYYKQVLFVVLGSCVTAALDITFPMIVRNILETVLPFANIQRLCWLSGLLFILYGVSLFFSWGIYYWGKSMGSAIEHDLRSQLFEHIEQLPFSFFDNTHTGQLLSRITNDISEIGEFTFQLPNLLIICSITMVGSAALLFYINWMLAILVLSLIAIKTVGTIYFNRQMKVSFVATREATGEMNAQAGESLNAIRLVQAFANERLELEKFIYRSNCLRTAKEKTFRIGAYMMSSVLFFSNLINLAIIGGGAFLILRGELRVGDLVAFLMYLLVFIKPIFQLTSLTEQYQRGLAGYNRYEELMAIQSAIIDKPTATYHQVTKGEVSFSHISFAYEPGEMVLQDVSMDIQAGQTVALVGTTGSGKSSLVSLLLRFYEPYGGHIYIDGIAIDQYTLASLRRQIGIVQQDVFLFSGTVRENILYGNPQATDEAIIQAAMLADADSFIRELPQGYDSVIGERGVKLSGGQKQRLAIARVFLKNPPILVLDEATSALDNETERKIQRSLQRLSESRTTLVIAHRLGTIRNADVIVVLEKGRIVEQGNHETLMNYQGKYYELYMSQFKKG